MSRVILMTSGPSRIAAATGPEDMNSTRSLKNGFPRWGE
jgi:hypothetical protein